jgi:hypothetical protein
MTEPLVTYVIRSVRVLHPTCVTTMDRAEAERVYERLKRKGYYVEFEELTRCTLKTYDGEDEQFYDGGYHPLTFAGEH